jgi:hypothetical protein
VADGRELVCSLEEYLAIEAVSSGGCADFVKSPATYHAKHVARTLTEPQSEGMLLGSAIHCAVLEADVFRDRYAIGPCNDKRTTTWKRWAETQGDHLTLLSASQGETIDACTKALRLHDQAAELLWGWPGVAEMSGLWTDDETGLPCKLRFDRVLRERLTVVELKSSRSADPDTVVRTAVSLGYHRRAAWYVNGHHQIYGTMPNAMLFVTVATEIPPSILEDRVNVWMLDPNLEELGNRDIRSALDGIAAARASGIWRAEWSRDVNTIECPRWMASAI